MRDTERLYKRRTWTLVLLCLALVGYFAGVSSTDLGDEKLSKRWMFFDGWYPMTDSASGRSLVYPQSAGTTGAATDTVDFGSADSAWTWDSVGVSGCYRVRHYDDHGGTWVLQNTYVKGAYMGDGEINRVAAFIANIIQAAAISDTSIHPRHMCEDSSYVFIVDSASTVDIDALPGTVLLESEFATWLASQGFENADTTGGPLATRTWVSDNYSNADSSGIAAVADSARTADGNFDFDGILDAAGAVDNITAGAVGAPELASTAVTPGPYTLMNGTVDSDGRLTAASNGTEVGDIEGVTAGDGLGGGGTTGTVTLDALLDYDGALETVDDSINVKAASITNAMLAGSIDLTTKVTGTLPEANGGTGDTDLDDIIGGDGLHATDGANTIIAGNATLKVLLDYDGGMETTDDSLNVKLDGTTLSKSASGLKVADDNIKEVHLDCTNSPADNYMFTYDAATGGFTSTAYNELTLEELEDYVGAMVTGNTETRITVTYQDADGTIDFVVDDPTTTCLALANFADSIAVTASTELGDTAALLYEAELDAFSELQTQIGDKTLVNEEDICTIDANWVNTANPWAVNEVHGDLLTATEGNAAYVALAAYADSFDVNMDGEKIIKEMLIEAPDGINAAVEFLYIDPLVYPNGITLKKLAISLPADAAYSMVFEEWAGNPPVWQNNTETVTTGGTDAYMAVVEADIDDKNLDASDMLYLDIPATDVPRIKAIAIFVRD